MTRQDSNATGRPGDHFRIADHSSAPSGWSTRIVTPLSQQPNRCIVAGFLIHLSAVDDRNEGSSQAQSGHAGELETGGEGVIILPAVSDEEAKQQYPSGWTAPQPYLRIVPQPKQVSCQ